MAHTGVGPIGFLPRSSLESEPYRHPQGEHFSAPQKNRPEADVLSGLPDPKGNIYPREITLDPHEPRRASFLIAENDSA
jgi:hypothetical protein